MMRDTRVTLSHGAGGRAMRELIGEVFVGALANPLLAPLDDQARIPLQALAAEGDRLAFTTDSYVVDPLFFPGGDIGRLAVCGTVNDLAVGGARPLYLSCGVILEEGFPLEALRRVVASMQRAADEAGVAVVTGDTKVVHRGAADKLFLNTTGIGVIPCGVRLSPAAIAPGDAILVNGPLGSHGAAVLSARGDLALSAPIESDCRPLSGLVDALLAACPGVRCVRDATRGGAAAVLHEFAEAAGRCLRLDEAALPVREPVRGLCEILGLDPLYLANEGTFVAVVDGAEADQALAALRRHPAGREAACIGRVMQDLEGLVVLATALGGERIVDLPHGEPLPRIC